MKISILDRAVLESVQPLHLLGYLRANDWKKVAEEPSKYSMWAKASSIRTAEVLVPINTDFVDYAQRISEALNEVAEIESRSQVEILEEIKTVAFDVFRLQVEPSVEQPGTIPLNQGISLFLASREMFTAAALAEHEPRFFYASRRPAQVDDFLGRILFGQTETSSYVVKTQIPIPPDLGETRPLFPEVSLDDEPYPRRVGIRLMTVLEILVDAALAAASEGSLEPFREAQEYGVSLNLCQAIQKIYEEAAPQGDVEVGVNWARIRSEPKTSPSKTSAPPRKQIRFRRAVLQTIQGAALRLKEHQPLDDITVIGQIEKLQQEPQEELFGEVGITGYVDQKPQKVRVRLPIELYHRALEAHREKAVIRLVGDLRRQGTINYLENPRGFQVLPTSVDEDCSESLT